MYLYEKPPKHKRAMRKQKTLLKQCEKKSVFHSQLCGKFSALSQHQNAKRKKNLPQSNGYGCILSSHVRL